MRDVFLPGISELEDRRDRGLPAIEELQVTNVVFANEESCIFPLARLYLSASSVVFGRCWAPRVSRWGR